MTGDEKKQKQKSPMMDSTSGRGDQDSSPRIAFFYFNPVWDHILELCVFWPDRVPEQIEGGI